MDSGDVAGLSFEDAFRQLAAIAEGMEQGGLTLSEATARFEQGMRLVQHCNFLLDTAELEITQLRESYQRPAASGGYRDGSGAAGSEYPQGYDGDDDETEDLPF